jgi:hypothetical protein
MWTFSGKLEVQPWTANDGYYLCMAREAFYTAAGPRDAWPCCITFISVHWQIAELMSADTAHAVRIPSSCPGLSSLVQRVNRQIKSGAATWLPHPCDWRLLHGGLCAAEYDEKILRVCARTNSGAADQNARRSVLHDSARERRSKQRTERSCTDLGDIKT